MAQAVPDRVPAACFGTVGQLHASAASTRCPSANTSCSASAAAATAATPTCDGLTNGDAPISAAQTSPIEILEALYPVLFNHYRIREGSAGAGERRGGFGMEYQITLRRGEAVSSVLGDRGIYPPYGLHDGHDAEKAQVEYRLGGKAYFPEHVSKDESVPMKPGDTARVATPGGGGWGEPRRRDPQRVLRDVQLEFVTVDEARRDYAVAVKRAGEGFEIDRDETIRLRQAAG